MAANTISNPFSLSAYLGAKYFCDRKSESATLRDALFNDRNVTLISPRRIGKTGLIRHVFAQIPLKEAYCFYVDIYDTSSLAEFAEKFAAAVLSKKITPFSARIWNEMTRFFGALRPTITTDPITGMPQCSIDIQPRKEEATLAQVFQYLEQADKPCYVAFDEFQAIAEYPNDKMEAILRSFIQHLTNVHFVFAGSKQHVMQQMFTAANRPFFQSTQMLQLDVIPEDKYYAFAKLHFAKNNQSISENVFSELYSLVDGHTWYVQALLNRLYQTKTTTIEYADVVRVLSDILEENTATYQMYCQLITSRQLAVLQAIAEEERVKNINSSDFLLKHNLGAASTVRSAVMMLLDKELLFEQNGIYSVYDRFFSLWLRR